jgi:hypothetical protein
MSVLNSAWRSATTERGVAGIVAAVGEWAGWNIVPRARFLVVDARTLYNVPPIRESRFRRVARASP